MKKHVNTLVQFFVVFLGFGAIAHAASALYPVGNVFCDGPAPAYFMGVKNSEEDAITSIAMWTQEYQEAGGEIAAGEDSLGKFGWSKDWQIVGIWVRSKEDQSRKHPCAASGHQGMTVECHYFVVHKDAPSECETCIEKAGLASYGMNLTGTERN